MPKPYPPQFRRHALNLVASGRTVRDVAALLGIVELCLYGWKSLDLIDRGLKEGATTVELVELAAARRRIANLEAEVKILRKAAATGEEVVRPKVRYRLVAELAADGVEVRCPVVESRPAPRWCCPPTPTVGKAEAARARACRPYFL